ncbi:hypothetical protein AB9F26_08960 [Falsihalocynthiibacter sp. BN13B15]|uniref:hypothetical protein n=1 Tax=Falsihalocynthiibacter sp. BN13B15 TaxID=3240871 RepID=UPI0035109DA1
MSVFKIISVAALVSMSVTGAFAQNRFEGVVSVAGWNIWKDLEAKTCFMERKDDLNNVVQMGRTTDNLFDYVGVFTQTEIGLKDGEIQEIQIVVGDHSYKSKSKSVRGKLSNGYMGRYFLYDNEQLAEDIAQQYVMSVFSGRSYALEINLDGTMRGMEAARKCMASF